MNLTQFKALSPCADGLAFVRRHRTLKNAWNKCDKPEWLFWYLEKCAPLDKTTAIKLAVAFAERSLPNFEKAFPEDKRPRLAIAAARNWAENPTPENESAAWSAASAAWSAASAAWSAAWSADSAAWSADSAAWSAAWSAEERRM